MALGSSAREGSDGSDEAAFTVGPAAEAPAVTAGPIASPERVQACLCQREQEFARLLRITERISYGVTLDEILDFVYQEMQPVIPYNRIGFSLIDDAPRGQVTARWARSDRPVVLAEGYHAPLEGSSLQQILSTGRPRIINDLEWYLERMPQSESTRKIVAEGMRSSLTCPLIIRGKPVGFLFFSSIERGTYSRVHTGFFRQVAGVLAGIVEQGRLYSELADRKVVIERQNRLLTEELEMARRVQRSLMPTSSPTVRGLEIACKYEPAIQIGGDLLDIIPLGDARVLGNDGAVSGPDGVRDGRVLCFVGDAMGHGVPAALVMAVAKTALQTAVMSDPRPAAVLEHINMVISRLNIDQFVTAACCLIDPRTGRTELALAGHPWPLWLRQGLREMDPRVRTGLPLGVEADTRYEVTHLELQTNDTLLFYTDGLVDAFDPAGRQYGVERLREQVLRCTDCGVAELLTAISRDLARHCSDRARADDVALLAVRTAGVGAS
jgi:serine phosphatase RsbU (regulator of sigma subunit)